MLSLRHMDEYENLKDGKRNLAFLVYKDASPTLQVLKSQQQNSFNQYNFLLYQLQITITRLHFFHINLHTQLLIQNLLIISSINYAHHKYKKQHHVFLPKAHHSRYPHGPVRWRCTFSSFLLEAREAFRPPQLRTCQNLWRYRRNNPYFNWKYLDHW